MKYLNLLPLLFFPLTGLRAMAAEPLMMPRVTEEYYYDNGWTLIGTQEMDYDKEGRVVRNVVREEDSVLTIETSYDSEGNKILVVETYGEGENAMPYSRRTYVYDPIVTNFCIERMGYNWSGEEWVENYFCEQNDITRNDAGNITSIVKRIPMVGATMADAYRTEWTYDDPAGEATGYRYYQNMTGNDDGWLLYNDTEYRDLKWQQTDGQMTSDLLELLEGKNRLESAAVYYKNELDGYIFVEYSGKDLRNYLLKATTSDPDEIGETIEVEYLDEKGSVRETSTEYFDEDENGSLIFTDTPVYGICRTYMTDDHGNPLSETVDEIYYGDKELVSGAQYHNTYDADGNLTEIIVEMYDYDTGEYFREARIVMTDYFDVTSGIHQISATTEDLVVSGHEALAEGMPIKAFGIDGRLLATAYGRLDLRTLPVGVCLLCAGRTAKRIMIK